MFEVPLEVGAAVAESLIKGRTDLVLDLHRTPQVQFCHCTKALKPPRRLCIG